VSAVVAKFLEHDLDLLGLTGVEDKLQDDVKSTLELLRNAGIKIWMLSGDKVETARCIAISTKLVARNQSMFAYPESRCCASNLEPYTKTSVLYIGDGGNDLIHFPSFKVLIVGKEGKQASLAVDFSVTQFSFLTKLLLWHGRNSYRRSAKLAQFVIH